MTVIPPADYRRAYLAGHALDLSRTTFSRPPSPPGCQPYVMHLKDIAEDWLRSFALAAFRGDVSEVVKTFLLNGWLRDALVFTWDTRSLEGHDKISAYLLNTLSSAHLSNFKLEDRPGLLPERVLDDAGIGAGFTFETPDRHGRGYFFLLQDDASEEWRALTVYVAVEDIKGHEELGREAGVYGGHTIAWEEIYAARRSAIESDPHVVISESCGV